MVTVERQERERGVEREGERSEERRRRQEGERRTKVLALRLEPVRLLETREELSDGESASANVTLGKKRG